MPIYEYSCASCGRVTEALQRLSDPPLAVCPQCGGALRKRISAPAFQFKGQGWYVTDYAKKGGAAPGGRSEGAPAASAGAESKGATGEAAEAAPKADPVPGAKPASGE